MSELRSYGDPCGIARALDIVGERWSLLIVRELMFGPKRFTDLRGGLTGASPNVLSQRLRDLEAGGVVRHNTAATPAYELTDRGAALHDILLQLGRWGAASPVRRAGELSVDALMVALESTFRPDLAGDLRASYDLRLGEARFMVDVGDSAIAITRGSRSKPDATIETDARTLRAVAFGDRKLAESAVALRGNLAIGRKFFRMFRRPPIIG